MHGFDTGYHVDRHMDHHVEAELCNVKPAKVIDVLGLKELRFEGMTTGEEHHVEDLVEYLNVVLTFIPVGSGL
jgi:hypothetical protein